MGSFPSGTSIKLHVLNSAGTSVFVSNNYDLGSRSDNFAVRTFPLTAGGLIVTNSFYAGFQPTGYASNFGWAVDAPAGNDRGRSYIYRPSDGLLFPDSTNDYMIEATVSLAPNPADFDGDGVVDGDDLAQWKGDFGVNGDSDGDGDGDSDGADFLAWQRALGTTAAVSAAEIVPEPTAVRLLGMAIVIGAMSRAAAVSRVVAAPRSSPPQKQRRDRGFFARTGGLD